MPDCYEWAKRLIDSYEAAEDRTLSGPARATATLWLSICNKAYLDGYDRGFRDGKLGVDKSPGYWYDI